MRRTLSVLILVALAAALALSGCIQVEKKEYRFKLKDDGTGEGTIRFVNIVSTDDNSKDVSFKDYAELVTDYLEGTKLSDDMPNIHITGKKLLEEDGKLVGEVNFTFGSPDSAGFYRAADCKCCPMIYFVKTSNGSETIVESNGKTVEGVAESPFLTWESGTRELTFKTLCMQDTSGARSLVPHYRMWKEKK
jgi:hypothetical protein